MAKRVTYDYNYLTEYCKQYNITLNKDYSKDKVTRETRIEAKCLYENCLENAKKCFRQLCKTGCYCKFHIDILRRGKTKKTNLERLGVENPLQSKKVKEKGKTTSLKKYGTEYPTQSEEIKEKIKQTNFKNYGVENPFQSEEIKEKVKQTNLKNYGVENPSESEEIKKQKIETNLKHRGVECPFQSDEVKEKSKQTCFKNHGVENPMQSEEIREKSKQTCLKNHGVENSMYSDICKDKLKQTNLQKFGVEYPMQSEEIREKAKQTCLERFGVEHAMQNAEVAEKSSKKSYSHKVYTFPSGKEINVQGYEPFALDELIQTLSEDDIITGCSNVPNIAYTHDEGKQHKHFPDIFIPSQNKCIEVKSTWTAEKKKDIIFLKQNAGKQLGYNYEIWVYNGKGEKVNCYI
jgi:hypothetical protein